MATVGNITIDEEGQLVSDGLHLQGFPLLLWKLLEYFGCTVPPVYKGEQREYLVDGVEMWDTRMTLPHNPEREEWRPWYFSKLGLGYEETVQTVAHTALTQLCEKYAAVLTEEPPTLFPLPEQDDRTWRRILRTVHKIPMGRLHDCIDSSTEYCRALHQLYEDQSDAWEFAWIRMERKLELEHGRLRNS